MGNFVAIITLSCLISRHWWYQSSRDSTEILQEVLCYFKSGSFSKIAFFFSFLILQSLEFDHQKQHCSLVNGWKGIDKLFNVVTSHCLKISSFQNPERTFRRKLPVITYGNYSKLLPDLVVLCMYYLTCMTNNSILLDIIHCFPALITSSNKKRHWASTICPNFQKLHLFNQFFFFNQIYQVLTSGRIM